jgi:putative ABC transport system permease protein
MNWFYYRSLFANSFESIKDNKLRSCLTMLGMIIGVASVIILVSIGTGAKRHISKEFDSLGSNIIHIEPGRAKKQNPLLPPTPSSGGRLQIGDVEILQRYSRNLEDVSGMLFSAGKAKAAENSTEIKIVGSNNLLQKILSIKLRTGRFISKEDDESGRRVVVLGSEICLALFGKANPLGELVKVNNREHRVIGVVKKTGDRFGFNMDEMVFIPTKSAMRILNTTNLFGIRATAKNRNAVNAAVKEIEELLGAKRNGDIDFTIITQLTMRQSLNTILDIMTVALVLIAMVSMLVGGIGIMNIMLVSVTERTREIGIRRAIGARKVDILRQFLIESIQISLSGGAIGVILALILTYGAYIIHPQFDMRPPIWVMFPAFFISVSVGLLFGVLPARKAANTETIDALRYE